MKKLLIIIVSVLALCSFTPRQVPNPKSMTSDGFVSNPDKVLSSSAVARLNEICAQAKKECEVEIAVVALKEINYKYEAFEFSQELFNLWGIGGKDKNQGVLVLLVVDSRDIRIHTGGGMEGILPDAVCENILEDYMYKLLGEGKWDDGIIAGVQAIYDKISSPQAKAELLLEGYSYREPSNFIWYHQMASCIVAILLLLIAYRESNWSSYSSNNVRYAHMANAEAIIWLLGIIFFGLATLVAVYFHFFRRGVRRKQIFCPVCHSKMKLLSEKDEDEFLPQDKQAEETLGSVDYDVWHCEKCSNNIILDYKNLSTKYTTCPNCGAKTFALLSDVVIRQPSAVRKGSGEKTYSCYHCHYREIKPYVIPLLIIPTGAGHGGRGGGMGGLGGGSWGGGMSFGGGAGGKF